MVEMGLDLADLGELLLTLVVAGLPAANLLTYERKQAAHARRTIGDNSMAHIPGGQKKIWVVTQEKNPWFSYRYEALSYLNLPGLFGALLIDRFTTWPDDWAPAWTEPLGMWGWRSLSWPVLSLPFWWLAGRGIDAFLGSLIKGRDISIRWFEAWGMGAFGLCTMVLGSCLAFMSNSHEDFPERWIVVSTTMWCVFGVISFVAWWRQRIASRSLAIEKPARTE